MSGKAAALMAQAKARLRGEPDPVERENAEIDRLLRCGVLAVDLRFHADEAEVWLRGEVDDDGTDTGDAA